LDPRFSEAKWRELFSTIGGIFEEECRLSVARGALRALSFLIQ
jgi:hypothetical protein